jgi:dTDP-4-dehydrorhamnose reductase
MNILVTGAHGTLGRALCHYLKTAGHTVIRWDRNLIPPHREDLADAFLRELHPHALFHLAIASQPSGRPNEGWQVNVEWPGTLAHLCARYGTRFILTSTTMVFTHHNPGPYDHESQPDADEGYGFEKFSAETRVFEANDEATIVRLGWQIGDGPGGNNMIDFFDSHMARDGEIQASVRWLPACSFIPDTCAMLADLLEKPSGLYQFNSNQKWNFYQIAVALNQRHGNMWRITPTDTYIHDQRMIDENLTEYPRLEQRLPELLAENDGETAGGNDA